MRSVRGRLWRILLGLGGALTGAFSAGLWIALAFALTPRAPLAEGEVGRLLLLLVALAAAVGGFSAALYDHPLSPLLRLLGRLLGVFALLLALGGGVVRVSLPGLYLELDLSPLVCVAALSYVVVPTLVDYADYHLASLELEEPDFRE